MGTDKSSTKSMNNSVLSATRRTRSAPMTEFRLEAPFDPAGDQPTAIETIRG